MNKKDEIVKEEQNMAQNIIGERIAGLLKEQGKKPEKACRTSRNYRSVHIQVYQRQQSSDWTGARKYCQGTAHHHRLFVGVQTGFK